MPFTARAGLENYSKIEIHVDLQLNVMGAVLRQETQNGSREVAAMKAFLSHSSKDKAYVREVAEALGEAICEYDEYTFEFTLNTSAIHRALKRCTIFVLFLSENSIRSSFIDEELRAALENRSKGIIRHFFVFSLDGTTYSALPEWLRDTNVVQNAKTPKHCARRIMVKLLDLETSTSARQSVYISRHDDVRDLRAAITKPAGQSPVVIHLVGHFGVGRRTFLRHEFDKIFPRNSGLYVELQVGEYGGIEEFYRQLSDYYSRNTVSEKVKEFTRFSNLPISEKIEVVVDYLIEAQISGDFVIVYDDGGVLKESGEYEEYISMIIQKPAGSAKPVMAFIQTRMMPFALRARQGNTYHRMIRSFTDDDTKDLLALLMKEHSIEYSEAQLVQLSEIVDNHPLNAKFAITYALSYGLTNLLANSSELVEWKRNRTKEFISRVIFSDIECDVLCILSEYRYATLEMLVSMVSGSAQELATRMRRLEEFCCVERRGEYYQIQPVIRDAVGRDSRFARTALWKNKVAIAFCEHVSEYIDEDSVSMSLLDASIHVSLKSGIDIPLVGTLILPSHLITVARDFYNRRHHREAIEFCARAYTFKSRMTEDAQVELLRIWGLAAARGGDGMRQQFNTVLAELGSLHSRTAKRVKCFVMGFDARLRGRLDQAEGHFLEAWELAQNNHSINRELATVYCKQGLYKEAERYARAAYKNSPTNPFIIDIFLQTLMGLIESGSHVDRNELRQVFDDLREYGDAPDSSFYLVRQAQRELRDGRPGEAIKMATRATERTPNLPPPYFMLAEAALRQGDCSAAEKNVKIIEGLLTDTGLELKDEEARLCELKARIAIERRQFSGAKTLIEGSFYVTDRQKWRVLRDLAEAVLAFRRDAEARLVSWASDYLKTKEPKSRSPQRRNERRRR